MERGNGFGMCFERSLTRLADKCDVWSERKRGNSGNSQTLDVRKSTDGPFPKMGTTRGTVGLDSKLKSPLLAVEMFLWKCRVGSNQDWHLTEKLGDIHSWRMLFRALRLEGIT